MKRIAIPCEGNRVSAHFGHAPQFAFFDADPDSRQIRGAQTLDAPPHEPGALPAWIAEQGASVVLTGGMGGRAQQLFAARGIEVVVGVSAEQPRAAVEAYLRGELQTGGNVCGHDGHPCK